MKIFPLGDNALTVEFGSEISFDLNQKAIALSNYFKQDPFKGFIETVPAYASTTIFYDLIEVRRQYPNFQTAFEAVKTFAERTLEQLNDASDLEGRSIEIPVDFSERNALDLARIAESAQLTPQQVIDIFTSKNYRVFMLGFLPGFSYMGEVDERIAVPRRESPRTKVPKGSVGIAGRQTGIYSLESPGGWQIIGRTDVELFSPVSDPPCFLQPGDTVRFINANQ
jgi:inhibitor of KinA